MIQDKGLTELIRINIIEYNSIDLINIWDKYKEIRLV
jgi:hypothetical protein